MASIPLRQSAPEIQPDELARRGGVVGNVWLLRRDLRSSMTDGIGWGGMVGLGETYLPAFALAVGLGELTAGLVASLPLLAGGIMQLISPRAIRALQSHKRWVVYCATLQTVTFVPLLIAAACGKISTVGLLLVATLYWATGLATGPAWNTWMGTLVPPAIRSRFFATRTRVSQAAVFGGFLAGGIILQLASVRGWETMAFAAIFAAAGLFRLVSVLALRRQSEPEPDLSHMRPLGWSAVVSRLHQHNGGRLLVYLVTVQAAVQFSGPYFTPFMLHNLKFSYASYVTLISFAYLAKVMALPLCGRLARRWGARTLLWIGGVGIVPLAAGWILTQNFAWLLLLQVVGGAAWGAYELAFFLLFFESIEQQERTSMLTVYNLINTAAWVMGASAGGLMLYWLGTSHHTYLLLFGLSSLARLAALVLLARVRPAGAIAGELRLRPIAVRPSAASMDAPILPSMPALQRAVAGREQ